MKKTNLLMAGMTLLTGGVMINVASNISATTVSTKTTTGKVTFKENTDSNPIKDPVKPDDNIDDNINGNTGSLVIDYASSFNFGEQKISSSIETYDALPDTNFKDSTGATRSLPNFVQITDKRGTNAGWTLTAKQESQLKTSTNKELKAAEIKIHDVDFQTVSNNKAGSPQTTATSTTPLTLKPGAAVQISTATAPDKDGKGYGMGTWTNRFGTDSANTGKAVSLTVPGESAKEKAEYSATITWSLEDAPI